MEVCLNTTDYSDFDEILPCKLTSSTVNSKKPSVICGTMSTTFLVLLHGVQHVPLLFMAFLNHFLLHLTQKCVTEMQPTVNNYLELIHNAGTGREAYLHNLEKKYKIINIS